MTSIMMLDASNEGSEGIIMDNLKIGNLEIPLGSLLLMLGGLIMLISVFLNWTQLYVDAGVFGSDTTNITGLDIISGKCDGKSISYAFLAKAPLFMLIFGILAIVLAALPLFKIDMPAIGIAAAVVALLGLIFAILFLTVGGGANLCTGDDKDAMQLFIDLGGKIKIQFGAYLALIGSLIATAGGALNVIPMFKK